MKTFLNLSPTHGRLRRFYPFFLSILALYGCQRDMNQMTDLIRPSLVAPSGAKIADSMSDVEQKVSTALSLERKNVQVTAIQYAPVTEGYACVVQFLDKGSNTTRGMILMSSNVVHKTSFSASMVKVKTKSAGNASARIASGETTAYCSCGNNTISSSACDVSLTVNRDGSVTGTCKAVGCSFGCVIHVASDTPGEG